jgi:uncharacterized protein YqeY
MDQRGPDRSLQDRLNAALRGALRARDQAAIAAFRSALAAIANAEAVRIDPDGRTDTGSAHFAGAAAGLGAAEAPRRTLSEEAITALVRAEVTERQTAASQYALAGHEQRAARLTAEADALLAVLDRRGEHEEQPRQ